jgi:3D (Asp-Asp-Asp) domain-containing protein
MNKLLAALAVLVAALVTPSTAHGQQLASSTIYWTKTVQHLDWQTRTHVTHTEHYWYRIKHPSGKVVGLWTRIKQRSPHVRVIVTYPRFAPKGYWVVVWSTGYSDQGLMSTGCCAGYGNVAVDPSVFPYGTRFYIPGYGNAVAADTNGRPMGLWIDTWWPTYAQCLAWTGNHRVFVYR